VLVVAIGCCWPVRPIRQRQPARRGPPGQLLQSLAELDGKAPPPPAEHPALDHRRRRPVLFVEARELPMFDLRLTFAAGSSQDGNTPGLATLTNAMLNEGVAGKDVTAIAEGFEAWAPTSATAPTATWPWPRCAASAPPTSATGPEAVHRSGRQADLPRDALKRIKNQMLAGFEYRSRTPARSLARRCSPTCTATTPTPTPATARRRRSPPSPSISCAPSTPRPMPPATR
jgi:zinc protease